MSTASDYQAQYDAVSAQQQELQAEYTNSLSKLDSENSSVAMVTIMSSTLLLVMYFIESQVMDSTITLDALSQMETDENTIQASFDDVNSLTQQYEQTDDDGNMYIPASDWDDYNAAVQADVDQASAAAADIEGIMALPEFSSIAGDVDTQLDAIFSTSDNGYGVDDTAVAWEQAWGVSQTLYSVTSDGENINYGYEGEVDQNSSSMASTQQTYTNAFSALSTDFSNMSSSTQSELQYYESEDQQMQGLDETLMQEYAQEEQTMINNQITT